MKHFIAALLSASLSATDAYAGHIGEEKWQDCAGCEYVDSVTSADKPLRWTHKPMPVTKIAKQAPANQEYGKGWFIVDMHDACNMIQAVAQAPSEGGVEEQPTTTSRFSRVADYVKRLGGDFAVVRAASGPDVFDQFDWNLQEDFRLAGVTLLPYQRMTCVADPVDTKPEDLMAHGIAQAKAALDICRRGKALVIMPTRKLYMSGAAGKVIVDAYMNHLEDFSKTAGGEMPRLIFSGALYDNVVDEGSSVPDVAYWADAQKIVGKAFRDKCRVVAPKIFWGHEEGDEAVAFSFTGDFFGKHAKQDEKMNLLFVPQTANRCVTTKSNSYLAYALEELLNLKYDLKMVRGVGVWELDSATEADLVAFKNFKIADMEVSAADKKKRGIKSPDQVKPNPATPAP